MNLFDFDASALIIQESLSTQLVSIMCDNSPSVQNTRVVTEAIVEHARHWDGSAHPPPGHIYLPV